VDLENHSNRRKLNGELRFPKIMALNFWLRPNLQGQGQGQRLTSLAYFPHVFPPTQMSKTQGNATIYSTQLRFSVLCSELLGLHSHSVSTTGLLLHFQITPAILV